MPDEEHAIPPIEEILNRVPGAFARNQEISRNRASKRRIPLGDESPQRPPTEAAQP